MLVLLDSNILFSALLTANGPPGQIYEAWRARRFGLLTCQEQLEEIRRASRHPKFRAILQPYSFGKLLNSLHRAEVWDNVPRKYDANDPADSYLLDLIDAAQPDYAVTGDKRAGLLSVRKLGRTRILTAKAFCAQVLHL